MDDVFARIGLAIRNLTEISTMNGPAKVENLRLADELQAMSSGISRIVSEEVGKQADVLAGDITGLKEDRDELKKVVFGDELTAVLQTEAVRAQSAPDAALAADQKDVAKPAGPSA